MKKTNFALPLALAFALAACAAPAGSPAADAAAPTTPTVAPAATAEPAPVELRAIRTTWSASMGPDAVYTGILLDSGVYAATRIDLKTGQQSVLCGRPGCTHSDESCPGFLWARPQGAAVAPTYELLAANGLLYWYVDARGVDCPPEDAAAYLDVSDLDGQNRRRLLEGDALPDFGADPHWLCDGETLYLYANTTQGGMLYRLEGNAFAELCRIAPAGAHGETPLFLGAYGDQLVLTRCTDLVEPPAPDADPSGAMAPEAWEEYQAAYDQARDAVVYSVWLLGLDGELTETSLHWTRGESDYFAWCDGSISLVWQDGTLHQLDLATGAETVRQSPFAGTLRRLDGCWNGYLTAYTDDEAGVPGSCYAWDLARDTAVELMPTWAKDQATPRVPVVLVSDDTTLFMKTDATYYTANATGKDGSVSSYTTSSNGYGIIPGTDFYTGSQAWVPVTLLARDLV